MAPITYTARLFSPEESTSIQHTLWNELAWVQHAGMPRREYYCPNKPLPYTYGRGAGVRTYQPQELHPTLERVWAAVQEATGTTFDVCFLNGYADQRDHLGWHSDDSLEMDDARSIAIVSLGAEREIWFRPLGSATDEVHKLLLQHGSLCLMLPGMQDTHQHRIPKAGRVVGERISFTFRGFDTAVV